MAMRITTLLVAATLSLFVTGSATPQNDASKALSLSLLIPDPQVCIGATKIDIEAAVKNISSEPISFSPSAMGSSLSLSHSSSHVICEAEEHAIPGGGIGSGSGTALAAGDYPWFLGSSSPPRMITVRPGETYWFVSSVPWSRERREPGVYDVSVGLAMAPAKPNPSTPLLGILHSNVVYFELKDCSNVTPPKVAH